MGIRVRIGTVIYLTDQNMSHHLEVKIIAEHQMRNPMGDHGVTQQIQ